MSPSFLHEKHIRNQLFRDESPESKKATYLLEENKIVFEQLFKGRDFLDCDFDLPALFSTVGTFHGIQEIEAFVKLKFP